jgi:uncharacterized protein (DUF1786 family)
MKILCVDVGTGTQDIFLYDARVDIENGFKLVVPSPTMIVHRRIKRATARGQAVCLTGVTMGGGPSHWAAEAHLEAGLPLYATPDAARSFNDDLDFITEQGIQVIAEEEVAHLPEAVLHLKLQDFDFVSISKAFAKFDVPLSDLDAVAIAVFDHGAAPPDVSDRKFRFDYLDERVRSFNDCEAHSPLSAFAFPAEKIPPIMTRMQAVTQSTQGVDAPLILMDTAPAAILGASYESRIASRTEKLIVNVGNFHTLAFRFSAETVNGLFEHHTGLLNLPKLDGLLVELAEGTISREAVFNDHGHGALVYRNEPLPFPDQDWGVAVTGPRRTLLADSRLNPHFPAPYGDMMLTGCFGLLGAVADHVPALRAPILESLQGSGGRGTPPWEIN